jgi:FtsP/CotA-like multicopper oxidase with cupredoxin domain
MNKRLHLSRRGFLKLGGGALAATAGARMLAGSASSLLRPEASVADAAIAPTYHLGGTDGWVALPRTPAIPTYHPDPLAPDPFTTYIFGFRNLTGMTDAQVSAQKNHAQLSAPILEATENAEMTIKLTNIGLALRPDLIDSHTMHWHGFRNAIPLFDGEPSSSLSVPIGRNITYYFKPRNPGTYMYHCHFEDTEHVHMGMTGVVFVRPQMGRNYAYNDASTAFDREHVMFLSEVWAEAHWDDAHIQLPDWTDYKPDFFLLNGRVYPDTLAPSGTGYDATGYLNVPAAPYAHLQYQPISSLVRANAGDKVLLRFVNLGYLKQSMTLPGLKMRVVGKDATLLKNAGADMTYQTNTVMLGPGESVDAIFQAPAFSASAPVATDAVGSYNTYLLYNRQYDHLSNAGGAGAGGQMTEVRVYASGVPAQTAPNT